MFTHYRGKGFILKETERGEADKVLTVFSRDFGRIEVLAKAVRKMQSKLRGNVPLFSISEIGFINGRSYKTLTDAALLSDFSNLKKNLEKLEIAYGIVDVFVRLVQPPQRDKRIWDLLKEVFSHLNSRQLSVEALPIIHSYFLWRLLAILGYQPELYFCLDCRKRLEQENLGFSAKGGVICESCRRKNNVLAASVQVNIVKILREIYKRNLKELGLIKLDSEYWQDLEKLSAFYLAQGNAGDHQV